MNNKVLLTIIIVVVLAGGLFLFTSMKPAAPAQTKTAQPSTETQASPTTGAAAASQDVTVSGSEFAFTPSTLTVNKGQPVKVTFKNMGKYPHNFTVSELNVQSDTVQPGETTTVTFTPDKAGSFTYICSVPGHADRGMKGTLTVQ